MVRRTERSSYRAEQHAMDACVSETSFFGEDGGTILERNGGLMARVVHFEIQADNPERAVRFYSDTFGWQAKKGDGSQSSSIPSRQEYWLAPPIFITRRTRPRMSWKGKSWHKSATS